MTVELSFKAYCRYPSGRHMCDSGGVYGRHWEKPPLPETRLPGIREWDEGCSATIELATFLEDNYEILDGVHEEFDAWLAADEERDHLSWFEAAQEFMEQYRAKKPDTEGFTGYAQEGRDNVCNGENDFSQVFIYEVWCPKDEPHRDWIYAHDEDIVVLFIHTGCDVRGGYSAPLFCKSKMTYNAPVVCCAEYYIAEARRPRRVKYRCEAVLFAYTGIPDSPFEEGPDKLDYEACQNLDEKWRSGYASWPYGQLEKDVDRWFEFTRTNDSVCVLLKTGEIAKVTANIPYTGY